MTDVADHISGKTGLTLTVQLSKSGAAFSTITPTVVERGSGRYAITLTSTDTNTLNGLDMQVTAPGADPTDTHDQVVAFDPNSATNLGLANLDAAVSSRSTYAGTDTPGTTTLLTRITAAPPTLAQISALFPNNFSTLIIGTGGTAGMVTASNGGSGGSGLTTQQDTNLAAIKAKTDQITFANGGVVSSLSSAATTALSTALGSASLAAGLTRDQAALYAAATVAGSYTIGDVNTTTHIQVYTYYVPGTTEAAMADGSGVVIGTSNLVYNSTNAKVLRRKYTPTP
jgi:hypothetical protein